MEPITHFLTGACMGRAGLNRKTALATATVTLAAEAPDLDVLSRFKGSVFGFAHHRGFTHSFLGLIIVSAVVVGLMYLIWRIRGSQTNKQNLRPRWDLLFFFAYLAGLSHILLDYTNNYGVRPFWPLSEKWYSWNIVFIVEPAILILLVAGLTLPALFRVIGKNSNSARTVPPGRLAATMALVGVVVLWGVRDFEHRRAVHIVRTSSYEGAAPTRTSSYPYWWTPFRWYSVAEMPQGFATMVVSSFSGQISEQKIYSKPPESLIEIAAKKSHLGRVYLDWAQYPLVQMERLTDSDHATYRAKFEDLRYAYPEMAGRGTLSAYVLLNREGEVIDERFGDRR